MMPESIIQYGSAGFAFVAAMIWLAAFFMKIPKAILQVDNGFIDNAIPKPVDDMDRLIAGLHRQGILNGWAAGFAAISALLQAISISVH
jgi:hypothetical protein